ncbi:DUF4239 domain-containing protein [Paracoccus aestuariivivens]|uniref:DUF4239 domain-containing protein n=1 Tax=Paracoccus aestuariivivens TaxID=1820333 RepID=A0A6L6JBU1_9RHOB|nr:DUF4239 domain-containing protein [Paracoccus aestuariivivens]MTH77634.1 DUF4239 domain-containing protein [Paracoccus aestuariivivens]
MIGLWPSAFYGVAFVGGSIAISLVTYFLTRALLASPEYERHKEMAGSVVVRLGALQGLILALVFAQEMTSYQRLEAVLSGEANAIADIYHDAERYEASETEPIKAAMLRYLQIATDKEWPKNGPGGQLSGEGWIAWDDAYRDVLNLTPESARQQALAANMLARIHDISRARNQRDLTWSLPTIAIFWFAAISGMILIAAGYYIFPPERQNIVLLSIFSAYTGIVMFMIFAFSNPYSPPAAIQPDALLDLLAQLRTG